ncbi:MAG TPA: PEP-CTERM sorting domain-containing protein [Verrucomicrobiae bacterium]|jgi:hypothetical protein
MKFSDRPSLTKILFAVGFALSLATTHAQTTTNLLINPGAETGDLTGWTPGGGSNPFAGTSSSLSDNIQPNSGSYDFCGGTGAPTGSLSQIVDLIVGHGITAEMIDGGTLSAEISFWEQGYPQGTPSDDAGITLTFYDGSENAISDVSTPLIDSHDGVWENFTAAYAIPDGTRSIGYTMNFNRNVGGDLDAFLDDNSLLITPTDTPEPTSTALLAVGASFLGLVMVKRQRS